MWLATTPQVYDLVQNQQGQQNIQEHKIVSWTSLLDLSDILSLLFNILMLFLVLGLLDLNSKL